MERKSKAFVETRLALRPENITVGPSHLKFTSSCRDCQEHYQGQLQELKKTMVGDVQRLQDFEMTSNFECLSNKCFANSVFELLTSG